MHSITIRFCTSIKKLLLASILIIGHCNLGVGQNFRLSLPISKSNIQLPKGYYISEIIDARGFKANLGSIYTSNGLSNLLISPKFESEILHFLTPNLSQYTANDIGISVTIRQFKIEEQNETKQKINGTISFEAIYKWNRSGEMIELTTYATKVQYTRGITNTQFFETTIAQILMSTGNYLDRWLQQNLGRNKLLAKGVKLRFAEFTKKESVDSIFYNPNRKLTYNDFTGTPRQGRYAAMVFTSFAYEGNTKMERDSIIITIRPQVFMVKSMSWIRPESKKESVLSHEQLHFDITYLIAKRFQKRLQNIDLHIDDHDSQIQYQYLETFREMHTLQKQYDEETRHGLNSLQQIEWEKKLAQQLKELL